MKRRQLAFLLMLMGLFFSRGVLYKTPPNSCLLNPPPNCTFDPVCTANCDVTNPYKEDPEANCECKLGCCMPID